MPCQSPAPVATRSSTRPFFATITSLVADERCQIRDKPEVSGFDAKQEKLLRSRKKGSKHLSEGDKWRDVYLILFPGTSANEIPSPCMPHNTPFFHEYSSLKRADLDFGGSTHGTEAESAFARYDRYLRRELPQQVHRELETRLSRYLEHLGENLKSQIVEIVRDAQASLYDNFLSASSRAPETERASEPFCESTSSASGEQPGSYDGTFASGDQFEACEPVSCLGGDVGDLDCLLFGLSSDVSHFQGGVWAGDSSVVGQLEAATAVYAHATDGGDFGYASTLYPAQLDLYDVSTAPTENV